MSMVADYHGHETRSRAMAFHQTSVYIGTIAGGFFAGLISQHYGWRWSFVVFGCLGIVLGIALRKFLKEPERRFAERRVPASEVLQTLFKTPTALLLMGAFLCSNFVAVVLLSWMPKFLFDRYHMSLAMSGLTATIYVQVASMVAAPFGGWLADWLRQRTPRGRLIVQLIGVAGGAPFVALCGLTHSAVWLVIALTAWGLFKGIYDANIWASLFDVVRPEMRGSSAGLMNMIGWLGGGGSAPIVIGVVSLHFGLGTAIALASSVYVAAAVLLLIAILGFARSDVLRLVPT
jgi:MFS family permease